MNTGATFDSRRLVLSLIRQYKVHAYKKNNVIWRQHKHDIPRPTGVNWTNEYLKIFLLTVHNNHPVFSIPTYSVNYPKYLESNSWKYSRTRSTVESRWALVDIEYEFTKYTISCSITTTQLRRKLKLLSGTHKCILIETEAYSSTSIISQLPMWCTKNKGHILSPIPWPPCETGRYSDGVMSV